MVRDMAAGERHVSGLVGRLWAAVAAATPASTAAASTAAASTAAAASAEAAAAAASAAAEPAACPVPASLDLASFLGGALEGFHAAALSSRDLLQHRVAGAVGAAARDPARAVLEPRTVVAGVLNRARAFVQVE